MSLTSAVSLLTSLVAGQTMRRATTDPENGIFRQLRSALRQTNQLLTQNWGATLFVDATNGVDASAQRGTSKAFKTLSAALLAAASGDQILMMPGTYTGNFTIPATITSLSIQGMGHNPNGVTITSALGTTMTIAMSDATPKTVVAFSNLTLAGANPDDCVSCIGDGLSFQQFNNAVGLTFENVLFAIADVDIRSVNTVRFVNCTATASTSIHNTVNVGRLEFHDCDLGSVSISWLESSQLPSGGRVGVFGYGTEMRDLGLNGAHAWNFDAGCRSNRISGSFATTANFEPFFRFAGVVKNVSNNQGAPYVDGSIAVDLTFENAPNNPPLDMMWGWDLSEAEIWGITGISYDVALAAAQDRTRMVGWFNGTKFGGDVSISYADGTNPANRLYVQGRGANFDIAPANLLTANGNVDIDARSCQLGSYTAASFPLSGGGQATLDRSTERHAGLTSAVSPLAVTFAGQLRPNYPAGASFSITTEISATAIGAPATTAKSGTGYTLTFTATPAETIDAVVNRPSGN